MIFQNQPETRAAIRRALAWLEHSVDPVAVVEMDLSMGDVAVHELAKRPLREDEQSGAIFSTAEELPEALRVSYRDGVGRTGADAYPDPPRRLRTVGPDGAA